MPRSRPVTKTDFWLALSILFFVIAGCQNPNAIEDARQRGVANGKIDGQRAGENDGYQNAYQPSYDSAYDQKLSELYIANSFTRKKFYSLVVVTALFLFGFVIQYAVLYGLRASGLLYDIDRIVLPKGNTQVDLTSVLSAQLADEESAKQLDSNTHSSTKPLSGIEAWASWSLDNIRSDLMTPLILRVLRVVADLRLAGEQPCRRPDQNPEPDVPGVGFGSRSLFFDFSKTNGQQRIRPESIWFRALRPFRVIGLDPLTG